MGKGMFLFAVAPRRIGRFLERPCPATCTGTTTGTITGRSTSSSTGSSTGRIALHCMLLLLYEARHTKKIFFFLLLLLYEARHTKNLLLLVVVVV